MSKIKTAYFCQNCGYESAKWLGKCPSCQQWNTFVEELIQKEIKKSLQTNGNHITVIVVKKNTALHEVETKKLHELLRLIRN